MVRKGPHFSRPSTARVRQQFPAILSIGLQSSNLATLGIALRLFEGPLTAKATGNAVAFRDASLAIMAEIIT